MIKKTITYKDFNDQVQVEDHYFHMSKTELINLEMSFEGGLTTIIPELIKEKNAPRLLQLFQSVMEKSYGKRSDDGKRFIKDPEVTAEFMQSQAWDALFTELVTSPESAAQFIQGIIPKDLMDIVEEAEKEKKAAGQAAITGDGGIASSPVGAELTAAELLKMDPKDMTHDQLLMALRLKTQPASQE